MDMKLVHNITVRDRTVTHNGQLCLTQFIHVSQQRDEIYRQCSEIPPPPRSEIPEPALPHSRPIQVIVACVLV